jgi:hypothetical protein
MYIMPDYSKAVIYKIETGGELYVGSTCNFTQRKYQHNSAVNFKSSHCNAKVYNTIRENGEWRMTPIKEFPCESKLQLTIEEEKCRKELGATLNTNCCGTGIETQDKKQYSKQHYEKNIERVKQYHKDNKEKINERHKQYHQDNKEKINERDKQYREQNKEKIRERQKQHYQDNKDKICEKSKKYYEKNKQKIDERNGQKIECSICGSIVRKSDMARHKRSAKCKAHI